MDRIRILLVIANDDFLRVVTDWLTSVADLAVVGTARSGRDAIEQAGRLRPDVVLMDLALRDIGGLEVTEQIKSAHGAPRVVLMTLRDSRTIRGEAAAAGADGFLAGADVTEKLMPLIRGLVDQVASATDERPRRAARSEQRHSRPLETPRDS